MKLIAKIKRRRKLPNVGDYVFAHVYIDADLRDPWQVGLIESISEHRSYLINGRYYYHAHLISREEGNELLISINTH